MTTEVLREHPEILINQIVKKTYQIIKILGKGTFSIVYQCINLETKEKLALKLGISAQGQKMLNVEKKIYRIMSSVNKSSENSETGFAKYYQFGKNEKFSYIVLERLSVSIEEIFIKLSHKFSIKTVLNIGLQGVELIQKIHNAGFIHRDIKPANFLLGHGQKKDKLYLIDFGLARKITEGKNQNHSMNEKQSRQEPEQQGKQFVGTKRFASIASHLGYQQSQKDDLQSLGYTLIFLLKGRLPWQGLKLSSKSHMHEMIGKIKQEIELEQFCRLEIKDQISYSGGVFLKMFRYLRVLNFGDTPNYEFLKKLMSDQIAILDKKQTLTNGFNRWSCQGKFDWMDQRDEARFDKHSRHKSERQRYQDYGQERDRDRDRDRQYERERDRDRDRNHRHSKNKHKQRYMR